MKKESLSVMTVKTLLAVVIFTGIGTIIIGGGYIIGEYSKTQNNNKTIKIIETVEENQKEELIISCKTDSDCEGYFSYNTCEVFCANKDEKNQKILEGFKKRCDLTAWFALQPKCGCIDNKCQQVVGERSYDLLEKKCDGNSCCLDALEYMKENNYKETKRSFQPEEKHNCPSGFKVGSLDCYTFLKWCEPVEEKYCFDGQNNRREIGEIWSESPTIFTECNEFESVSVNHVLSCGKEKLIISAGYSSNENNINRTNPSLPFFIGTDLSLKYTWVIDGNKYTSSSGGPTGVFASCENEKAAIFSFGGMGETYYKKTFFENDYKTVISCLDSLAYYEEGGRVYDENDPKNFTIGRFKNGERAGEFKLLENGKEICQEIKERYQEIEETTIGTLNWQIYQDKKFGFEMKCPEYYNRLLYDFKTMKEEDYNSIHFFRDMSEEELNDFKENYLIVFEEGGTHSGTVLVKSYNNEEKLKKWYEIESFEDLEFKEFDNVDYYIANKLTKNTSSKNEQLIAGYNYIIPHREIDNLFLVFEIPEFLKSKFEKDFLPTFKFTQK